MSSKIWKTEEKDQETYSEAVISEHFVGELDNVRVSSDVPSANCYKLSDVLEDLQLNEKSPNTESIQTTREVELIDSKDAASVLEGDKPDQLLHIPCNITNVPEDTQASMEMTESFLSEDYKMINFFDSCYNATDPLAADSNCSKLGEATQKEFGKWTKLTSSDAL